MAQATCKSLLSTMLLNSVGTELLMLGLRETKADEKAEVWALFLALIITPDLLGTCHLKCSDSTASCEDAAEGNLTCLMDWT
jgi:hypothetical protein